MQGIRGVRVWASAVQGDRAGMLPPHDLCWRLQLSAGCPAHAEALQVARACHAWPGQLHCSRYQHGKGRHGPEATRCMQTPRIVHHSPPSTQLS